MSKSFRGYDQGQQFLLPPSLDDWLPEDDEARFISEVVEEVLDLSPIYGSYASASGAPPYEPRMMLKLLLFAYATGVTSSREVERRCTRDIRVPVVVGQPGTGLSVAGKVPSSAPGRAAGAVHAGAAHLRAGGAGQAGACCAGWHEACREHLEAQGDEL